MSYLPVERETSERPNGGVKRMLDPEWVKLILQAKQLGLTIEEVREFFKKKAEYESKLNTG